MIAACPSKEGAGPALELPIPEGSGSLHGAALLGWPGCGGSLAARFPKASRSCLFLQKHVKGQSGDLSVCEKVW